MLLLWSETDWAITWPEWRSDSLQTGAQNVLFSVLLTPTLYQGQDGSASNFQSSLCAVIPKSGLERHSLYSHSSALFWSPAGHFHYAGKFNFVEKKTKQKDKTAVQCLCFIFEYTPLRAAVAVVWSRILVSDSEPEREEEVVVIRHSLMTSPDSVRLLPPASRPDSLQRLNTYNRVPPLHSLSHGTHEVTGVVERK